MKDTLNELYIQLDELNNRHKEMSALTHFVQRGVLEEVRNNDVDTELEGKIDWAFSQLETLSNDLQADVDIFIGEYKKTLKGGKHE